MAWIIQDFNETSGFSHTNASHRQSVSQLTQCETKHQLSEKESSLGCRYSSLLKLPYFDPPKMLVIDPMHNLFLGVAKHIFKKGFIEEGILSNTDLVKIQERINKTAVPSDIG